LITLNPQNLKMTILFLLNYIIHPHFIVAIRFMSGILGLEKVLVENNLILYIVVSLVSLVFMLFVERAKGLIKNGKH